MMPASKIFSAWMQTFSQSPFSGLPVMGPGQWSEEKLEKNDIGYLRGKNINVLFHAMRK